ncbi:uncharacterized protein LOC125649830 [Ostrea edulis]|uniref:uncharacterized protein LOC125649830 n=1 Tax=Ostrea edulis TaxID=37623 RepID=UPI0024AEB7FF|nr:uncharacterized protein LOC125649830 [Ostrea edulis]
MLKVILVLLAGLFSDRVEGFIRCYSCNGQPASICVQRTVTCPSDHMCFMESISSSNNETLFVAGCRTKKLCSWMVSPVGRRSIVDQCAECCDAASSPLCNGRLCNFTNNITSTITSNRCRVCSGLHVDASTCQISQCGDNEMCFTGTRYIGGLRRMVYGCENAHMCLVLAKAYADSHGSPRYKKSIVGDTGLHVCDACCSTNDCNARPCNLVAKEMPLLVNMSLPVR